MMVAIGRIRAAHGLKGYLKAEAFSGGDGTVRAQRRLAIGESGRDCAYYAVEDLRSASGKNFLLKLEGVDGPDEADCFRGRFIFIDETLLPALPEGSFYGFMLERLEVRTTQGQRLGVVARVEEYPANDIIVVLSDEGREILVPAIKDIVKRVDMAEGAIYIEDRKGLR